MPTSRVAAADNASQDVIESIAKDTHHPIPVVRRVYEEQLAQVAGEARIGDYVVLFAARRTRDLLARRAPSRGR